MDRAWDNSHDIKNSKQNQKLLIQQSPKDQPKNIKELFKDFNSENYNPSEIDWGRPAGEELW